MIYIKTTKTMHTTSKAPRRGKPDIEELIARRDELLTELHELPFKERDYTEYRKAYMKVKYYTNEAEIVRQREHSLHRIKEIYDDEDKHNAYKNYMKNYMKEYQRKKALQKRALQAEQAVPVF